MWLGSFCLVRHCGLVHFYCGLVHFACSNLAKWGLWVGSNISVSMFIVIILQSCYEKMKENIKLTMIQ